MSNKELAGNIEHEISPVIGWMRLSIADGEPMTPRQMTVAVEKLYRAIDNAHQIV